MPNKYDPILGEYRQDDSKFRGVLATAPSNPIDGWTYVNSGDNGYYIYYGETWQLLHTLTPAALEFLLLETGDFMLLETGDKLAVQ